MVLEFLFIKMGAIILDNGKLTKNVDMEFFILKKTILNIVGLGKMG